MMSPSLRRHDAREPESMSVGLIDVDGRRFRVSLRTFFDGVEYVGRLVCR